MIKQMRKVVDVHGDFAEFGIDAGSSFIKIIREAKKQNKITYAFDSFHGFTQLSKFDYDDTGYCHYPKGTMNRGGTYKFHRTG